MRTEPAEGGQVGAGGAADVDGGAGTRMTPNDGTAGWGPSRRYATRRQTAGSFWRVLTMPPIRPMPMMTSAPAMIHDVTDTPMRDAA